MSDKTTPEPCRPGKDQLRRERDLLLTRFDPAEFGCASSPVFTELAEPFSVRDELASPVGSEEPTT